MKLLGVLQGELHGAILDHQTDESSSSRKRRGVAIDTVVLVVGDDEEAVVEDLPRVTHDDDDVDRGSCNYGYDLTSTLQIRRRAVSSIVIDGLPLTSNTRHSSVSRAVIWSWTAPSRPRR